jgi:hypothetical protein
MRKPLSSRPAAEVPAVKPEVFRLAVDTPLEAAAADELTPACDPQADVRLKFVQIGVWEARRRLLAGLTEDLGVVLAHLDEDVELLRQALEGEPARAGKRKPRRREPAPLG